MFLDGRDVTRLPQHARARHGLARTFQINQLFRTLNVVDNIALALGERTGSSRHFWRPLGNDRALFDEAFALLESLGLADQALQPVATLPYGRQRLVEIALALAARPKVLLLDEPAAGVPSAESHLILDAIAALPAEIAVLIVEHDMDVVFRFAERITVLAGGAILTEGTPAEIAADEQVRAVYLGRRARWLTPPLPLPASPPATARPSSSKPSTSRCARARASASWAATASARPR